MHRKGPLGLLAWQGTEEATSMSTRDTRCTYMLYMCECVHMDASVSSCIVALTFSISMPLDALGSVSAARWPSNRRLFPPGFKNMHTFCWVKISSIKGLLCGNGEKSEKVETYCDVEDEPIASYHISNLGQFFFFFWNRFWNCCDNEGQDIFKMKWCSDLNLWAL